MAEPSSTAGPGASTRPATRAGVLRWLSRFWGAPYGGDPAAFDGQAVEETLRALSAIAERLPWFPLDARGLEQVPPPPAILVMNHSGGTTIPDVWGFLVAWYRHFGTRRPIHPLAHEFVVGTPLTGGFMERRGVLLADHRVARRAIVEHGHDVLVLPGGDAEAWRRYRDRWRVDFSGRRGYARLAIDTGTPVVPIAHAGAHETLIVLLRGDRLAHAIGLRRFARAGIFPISISLPWGLAVGPLPHLPLPAPMRYRVSAPLRIPDEVQLDREVRAAIQTMLVDLQGEGDGWRDRARWLGATLRSTRAALSKLVRPG